MKNDKKTKERETQKKKPSNLEAGHPFLFWKPIMRGEEGKKEKNKKSQNSSGTSNKVVLPRIRFCRISQSLTREERRKDKVSLDWQGRQSPVSWSSPMLHLWELGENCKKLGSTEGIALPRSMQGCKAIATPGQWAN